MHTVHSVRGGPSPWGAFRAAAMVAAAFVAPQLAMGDGGSSTSSVFITLGRLADCHQPGTVVFHITASVELADWDGVTGFEVTSVGGLQGFMAEPHALEWSFGSFESMKAAAHGQWSIHIYGASPSISVFTLSVSNLLDADIFELATVTSPQQGTAICADSTCSWNPPGHGPFPAYAVNTAIRFWDKNHQLPSIGALTIPDNGITSWDPDGCMLPWGGFPAELEAVLEIDYASVSPSATATQLVVNFGQMSWGTSPFAPPGFPPQTPFVILNSATESCFTVLPCEPADVNCDNRVDGADLGTMLGNWGNGGLGDLDNNGLVDGADLGSLLGAWTG